MSDLTLHSTISEAHAYATDLIDYAYTQLHTLDRMQSGEAKEAAHSRLCQQIAKRIDGASDALAICLVADPSTLAAARTVTVMGGKTDIADLSSSAALEAAIEQIVALGEARLSTQLYMTAALCTVMIAEQRLTDETTPQVTTPQSEGGTEGDPLGVEGE